MRDTVSAVICVKNGEKTLENALLSLKIADIEEIIVIDGGSTDDSITIAKKYSKNIWSDDGRGLGYARQIGAEKATGRYVLYLDADAELSTPSTVEQMLDDVIQFDVSGVQAQLIDPREHKTYWEEAEDFHRRIRYNKPGKKIHADTNICLILRSIILEYKFDPYFAGAAEDSDFFFRIEKAGFHYAVSKAIGYHSHALSFRIFIKQKIWYGKGNARMAIKNKTLNPVFLPFLIMLYGWIISLMNNKTRFIPFYCIWTIFLMYGTVEGFWDLISSKYSLGINRENIIV
jgi:glycosyltransferase involved in cell wall biosynthesis